MSDIDSKEFISINPEIRFGKPCIKGTRKAVVYILHWIIGGMSYDEIIEDFPSLKKQQILTALAFSAKKEEITRLILK
jgi:uncharacterized protein (DUF433 family)